MEKEVGVITDTVLRVQFPACELAVPSSAQSQWDIILSGLKSEIPIRYASSKWYRIVIGCNVPDRLSRLGLDRGGGSRTSLHFY